MDVSGDLHVSFLCTSYVLIMQCIRLMHIAFIMIRRLLHRSSPFGTLLPRPTRRASILPWTRRELLQRGAAYRFAGRGMAQ